MYELTRVCEIDQDNLKQNQAKMKQWYAKDVMLKEFKSSDVLIYFTYSCKLIHKTLHIIYNTNTSIFTKPFFFQKGPPRACPKKAVQKDTGKQF
jgi:hypothetical protein